MIRRHCRNRSRWNGAGTSRSSGSRGQRNATRSTIPRCEGIGTFFANLQAHAKAVVLDAVGENFSAGLDLSELSQRSTVEGVAHSMMWHRVFDQIEFGHALHRAALGKLGEIRAQRKCSPTASNTTGFHVSLQFTKNDVPMPSTVGSLSALRFSGLASRRIAMSPRHSTASDCGSGGGSCS